MDAKSKEPHTHDAHRKRVRSLFLEGGLDGFSDHNVLELLLFYCIPQRDTNLTAHNLIERFGSLRGVLDASVDELCQVSGMGRYSATFLSIMPQLVRRYCAENTQIQWESDRSAMLAFFRARFIGERYESVYLVGFDVSGRNVGCIRLASGTPHSVSLGGRLVLEGAFRMNAASVVLAHNHPGGVAAPSTDDVSATKQIAEALRGCSIRLIDHVIVGENDCFSMATHPRFRTIFI